MRNSLILKALLAFSLAASVFALNPAAYFPLSVGARWNYEHSDSAGHYNSTALIAGSTIMDGLETKVMVETDEFDSADTSLFQVRGDGLYTYYDFSDGEDGSALMAIRMVPNPFDIGDEWVIYEKDSNFTDPDFGAIVDLHIEIRGRAIERGSITVPAGRFSNAIHFAINSEVAYVVTWMGFPMFADTTIDANDMWFASIDVS